MYKQAADLGVAVIQEQGFFIVDTRESGIATPLSPFCLYSYGNQIFLVGRHQGVHQFVSPDLHRVMSISSHCGMSRDETHMSTWFGSFLPSPAMTICHQASLQNGELLGSISQGGQDMVERRGRYWSMAGRSDEGHTFQLSCLKLC